MECKLVFGSKLFDFDLNSNSMFKENTAQCSDIMSDSLFNLDVFIVDMIVFSMHSYSIRD